MEAEVQTGTCHTLQMRRQRLLVMCLLCTRQFVHAVGARNPAHLSQPATDRVRSVSDTGAGGEPLGTSLNCVHSWTPDSREGFHLLVADGDAARKKKIQLVRPAGLHSEGSVGETLWARFTSHF